MLQSLAAGQDPIQLIEDILYKTVAGDHHHPKGCLIVNATTEYQDCRQTIQSELTENKDKLVSIFKGLIDQAKANGYAIAESSEVLANYLYTLMSGIQVIAKIEHDKDQLLATIRTGLAVLGHEKKEGPTS